MPERKKALVVDFNNIWNKYLFVRKGDFAVTVGAVLYLFRSIYQAKQFSKVYIVIDGKPCSKYEEYKEYKQNRKKNPDKYIPMKVIVSVLSQYFTVVGGKEVEGDEVTAYIAKKLSKNYDTYIYSNDKDFIQLMQFGVNILVQLKKGMISETLSEEQALAKFKDSHGAPLEGLQNVLPYRVFKGDSSDGIPSACKGLFDSKIRDIIYNDWQHSDNFNEDTLMLTIGHADTRGRDELAKVMIENKNNIIRNYKLMNLSYIPDSFKDSIKKIWYKLDVAGLNQYIDREDFYKWN
jgi:hypothetical protein